MRAAAVLVAAALAGILAGCGSETRSESRIVVAAFYPLAWVVEEVAGEDVEVVNLTPPGAEPHDIELTARDVERVRDADLVLYLGEGFMPALEKAIAGVAGGRGYQVAAHEVVLRGACGDCREG